MKKLLPLLLFIFSCSTSAFASTTPEESPIVPGQLLIKLKPSFVYLNAHGKGMRANEWSRMAPGLAVSNTFAFSTFTGQTTKSGVRRAGQSGVDLRLYHQLSFDQQLPVAYAIEQLYKSGVVELAEPVYAATPFQTANDPLMSRQYYLDMIKAPEAWALSTGSEKLVIAILDSGVDLEHPDLAENIYLNENDPLDGIDNDNDGFIDNYQGWDFAGADYLTLIGDNNPSTNLSNASHGTKVAGCASAVTNNGVGVAGVAFNARLMVLKHTADNDKRYNGTGYLLNLLQGVFYAATHGADIINASYGSTSYSQIEQDLYKLAALEYGVLVVAASGNNNSEIPMYPASYEHVLSVGASTGKDTKASFSNYGQQLDLTAPGDGVFTTKIGGGYEATSGTSFAAPLVAGAAALLKAKYPDFTGVQLGALLRISADTSFNTTLSDKHRDKMGRGRLNIATALTANSPSVMGWGFTLADPDENWDETARQASLSGNFQNLLWPAKGLQVKLVSLNNLITVEEPAQALGDVEMLEEISTENSPFIINISEELPSNTKAHFRLDYTADGYKDHQYFTVLINPTFIDVHENLLATTLASDGRVGYVDASREFGQGFMYDGVNMLYEMGIIMATSNANVLSNVRSVNSFIDEDFRQTSKIKKQAPGALADVEVLGSFNGSGDTLSDLDLEVEFSAFVWRDSPDEKSVIVEYIVRNKGQADLEDYYLGLYADWDINTDSFKDKADWDSLTNTGYVYSADLENGRVGAIQVLSGEPNYWAVDNDASIADNPLGVYDGFTDEEKFRTISSGIGRARAGLDVGTDVSHSVASGPYTIAAGDSAIIAFALHGGSAVSEVLQAARTAKKRYEETILASRIVAGTADAGFYGLRLYPNPTRGALTISFAEQHYRPLQIRVMDASGRQINSLAYAAGTQMAELQMPDRPGMYLLELSSAGKRLLKRIVVQ
ncbi:S8/S53 family peptidase [Cesiribacter sp. SM1]|uniref:S8/S53 family peptidase n=1 Tax=Cesiribacter sp. SM1 TaxID=2861196 RepID=UPI001CD4FA18|nr:S8/S53 family peptidase [Cesiribacter sp. SM1]